MKKTGSHTSPLKAVVLSAALSALLIGCETYVGGANESEILSSITSHSRGTPETSFAAAVFHRIQGLDRVAAIRILEADGAQCQGNICSWSATRYPDLITIGPAGQTDSSANFIWTVELVLDQIQEIDDLRAQIIQQ